MTTRLRATRLLVLPAALALLGGTTATLAQEATPAAGQEQATASSNQADPRVGDAVPYVDENGVELGTASVVEVTDPFTGFDEYSGPDEGERYVAFTITVAGTDGSLEADPNDFGLQTVDGYFFSPAYVNRKLTTADIPDLDRIEVVPDTERTGTVIFAVAEDAELARLLWQPDSGRLFVVADLRDQG